MSEDDDKVVSIFMMICLMITASGFLSIRFGTAKSLFLSSIAVFLLLLLIFLLAFCFSYICTASQSSVFASSYIQILAVLLKTDALLFQMSSYFESHCAQIPSNLLKDCKALQNISLHGNPISMDQFQQVNFLCTSLPLINEVVRVSIQFNIPDEQSSWTGFKSSKQGGGRSLTNKLIQM